METMVRQEKPGGRSFLTDPHLRPPHHAMKNSLSTTNENSLRPTAVGRAHRSSNAEVRVYGDGATVGEAQ